MKAEYRDNEKDYLDYYDEVAICTESAKAHYKSTKKRALFSLNMVILLLKKQSTVINGTLFLYQLIIFFRTSEISPLIQTDCLAICSGQKASP